MSAKHFQLLVVKALWEEDFRRLLFSRPEEATKDFDLTHEERAELRRMERERFEDLVVEYRLRLTKEALGPGFARGVQSSARSARKNHPGLSVQKPRLETTTTKLNQLSDVTPPRTTAVDVAGVRA